jgi:hypothetical protein
MAGPYFGDKFASRAHTYFLTFFPSHIFKSKIVANCAKELSFPDASLPLAGARQHKPRTQPGAQGVPQAFRSFFASIPQVFRKMTSIRRN